MARDTIERELSAPRTKSLLVEVATADDDAEIRRLFRDNPMPGRIGLSFERKPDYFGDANLPGQLKQTIVTLDSGKLFVLADKEDLHPQNNPVHVQMRVRF